MAGGNSGGNNSNHSRDGGGSSHHRRPNSSHTRDMTALEAAAVHKAKLTADANFRPSHAIMNDTTLLLSAVDGPNLTNFQCDESVYVGRNVPIAAGAILMLPITIAVPGSFIEYIVECTSHDIIFGIIAERDNEGSITTVKVRFYLFLFGFGFTWRSLWSPNNVIRRSFVSRLVVFLLLCC
jgi:hypothetical protein